MSKIPRPFPHEAVSFDMDGTLYSLERLKIELFLRCARDIPHWRAMEKVRRRIRRQGVLDADMQDRVVEAMAAELDRPRDEVAATARRLIHEQWPALLQRIGPFKPVRKMLEALVSAQIPIVLVSDYPGRAKAEALGLGDLPWVDVIDATALGALKPRPEVYHAAADALGLPPGAVLHVGDSAELDVQGAAAIGMPTALVKKAPKPPAGENWVPATYAFGSVPKFCKALLAALETD